MSKVIHNEKDDAGDDDQADTEHICSNIIIDKTDFGWVLPEDSGVGGAVPSKGKQVEMVDQDVGDDEGDNAI